LYAFCKNKHILLKTKQNNEKYINLFAS